MAIETQVLRPALCARRTLATEEVASSIRSWLGDYLAELLTVDRRTIDEDAPFERYGLDSSAMVVLVDDLGKWIGCDIDPAAAYDYPSIADLAFALAQRTTVVHALSGVLESLA